MILERLVTWIAKVRESAPKCFSIALPTLDARTLQQALTSQSERNKHRMAASRHDLFALRNVNSCQEEMLKRNQRA